MLTREQLLAVFPNATDPDAYAEAIAAAWDRFGFTTKGARAGFLGIIGNETGGLRTIGREDMRYSAERAFELFPKARQNPDVCRDRCSSVPQDKGRRFASWIYADLYGNGPEATEDGWKYRGGGMVQLTFKSTYAACGEAAGIDLVGNPDLIVTPAAAALSACWFMARYKPAILAHFDRGTANDFLAGGALVGWTNDHHTGVRLGFRDKALAVVDGGKPVDLRAVQSALAAAGHDPGPVDGQMGPRTITALAGFQRIHGLPATGAADEGTRKALGLA
jgi:putative chitinase